MHAAASLIQALTIQLTLAGVLGQLLRSLAALSVLPVRLSPYLFVRFVWDSDAKAKRPD